MSASTASRRYDSYRPMATRELASLASLLEDFEADEPTIVRPLPVVAPVRALSPVLYPEEKTEIMDAPVCPPASTRAPRHPTLRRQVFDVAAARPVLRIAPPLPPAPVATPAPAPLRMMQAVVLPAPTPQPPLEEPAPEPAPPKPAPVVRCDGLRMSAASITGIHTRVLTLTPAFHEALKQLAPKRRSSKIPYVVVLGLVAIVAVLGADRTTRDFLVAQGDHISAAW
jgi:hypothetical protein